MKVRNVTRLGALALTMCLVTTSLVGGTLAKYTTTVSGTDTVTVARFVYETNDGTDDIEFAATAVDIDLFDDLTTAATGTIATDGDKETSDTTDTGDLMLAPGAYGSFQIEMNALYTDLDLEMSGSEVTAAVTGAINADTDEFLSYTISYTTGSTTDSEAKQTAPTVITSYGTTDRMSVNDLADDLQAAIASIILQKNTVGVITVEYAWVDDGKNDEADTTLGLAWAGVTSGDISSGTVTVDAAPQITLTIKNVVSQVTTASPTYTTATPTDGTNSFAHDGVVATTTTP